MNQCIPTHLGKSDGQFASNLDYVSLQTTILNMTSTFITRAEVNAQFSTLAVVNSVVTALNNEITARAALGASLTSEMLRATASESTLTANVATVTANLNNEISTRAILSISIGNINNNIATLTANLNTEVSTRTDLGTSLSGAVTLMTLMNTTLTANLNTEISTRALLSTSLASVVSNVTTLITNLNNEITVRTNTDATITNNVNAEIANRGTAITTETNRALAAESILASNIATVTTNLNNMQANISSILVTVLPAIYATNASLTNESYRAILAETNILNQCIVLVNNLSSSFTPGAPTAVSATAVGGSFSFASALISFLPALSGSFSSLFYVTSNPGNIVVSGKVSPITISNMTGGVNYTFTVTAYSVSGVPGDISTPSIPVTMLSVPFVPSIGIAVEIYFGTVRISFNTSTNNGGSPITSYSIMSNPPTTTQIATSSPFLFSGLLYQGNYSFSVVANNALGASLPSISTNAVQLIISNVPFTPIFSQLNPFNDGSQIAYFPLNGNTTDLLGNYNGVVSGSLLYSSVGCRGGYVSPLFSSGNFFYSNINVPLTGPAAKSIFAWVKLNSLTQLDPSGIISFGSNTGTGTMFQIGIVRVSMSVYTINNININKWFMYIIIPCF